jgi:hypothetical protein
MQQLLLPPPAGADECDGVGVTCGALLRAVQMVPYKIVASPGGDAWVEVREPGLVMCCCSGSDCA